MNKYIIWFEGAAWLTSLVALPRLWSRPPLRIFPLLLSLVVGVEALQYFGVENRLGNVTTYNLLAIAMWLLYATSLYLALQKPSYRRTMVAAAILFVAVVLSSYGYYQTQQRFNTPMYATGTLMMVLGVLLKFYEMLKSPGQLTFLKDPFFYILFALLLFSVGTLPYFIMGNWLFYDLGRPDLVKALANVMSILNYLLYGTYTVCFVWISTTKASSS